MIKFKSFIMLESESGGNEEDVASRVMKDIDAPSHAMSQHKNSHGSIAYYKHTDHAQAHRDMTSGGFVKTKRQKSFTQHTKMGHSAAYSSTKKRVSEYAHPEGHSATVTTSSDKYSNDGPMTYYQLQIKK